MKTGRLRHVRILAPTCSANLEWGRWVEHSYDGHADLFIIVCLDDPRLLAIPVREAPARKITLRVAPSRNGQRHGVRWAADHHFSRSLLLALWTRCQSRPEP